MGRWAQARRRGCGGIASSAFALAPPVFDTEWQINPDGSDSYAAQTFLGYPSPAVFIQFSWHIESGPEDDSTEVGEDSNVHLASGDTGDMLYVKARWLDGDSVPLSDYSAYQAFEFVEALAGGVKRRPRRRRKSLP